MKTIRPILSLLLLLMTALVPASAFAQDTIFLPFITGAEYWPDGSLKTDPYDIDIFNLPPCDIDAINASLAAGDDQTPDFSSKKGCKVSSVPIGIPTYLEAAGAGQDVAVAPANADDSFMPRKFSLNQFYCTTCTTTQGATGVVATLSEGQPTIASGSWSNYWYGNYVTIGGDINATCSSTLSTLTRYSIGMGTGKLTQNNTVTSHNLYYKMLVDNSCLANLPSPPIVLPNSGRAVTVEVYKSGQDQFDGNPTNWTGRAYINGEWAHLFTNHPNTDITYSGHIVNVGQEIGTNVTNGHTNVKSPLNFAHKIRIRPYGQTYKPFYLTALPSYFSGKVNVIIDTGTPRALVTHSYATGSPDFTSRTSMTP